VEQCRQFEEGLYAFVESTHMGVFQEIRTKKALDKELEAKVRSTIEEFKVRFVRDMAAAVKANA